MRRQVQVTLEDFEKYGTKYMKLTVSTLLNGMLQYTYAKEDIVPYFESYFDVAIEEAAKEIKKEFFKNVQKV